MRRLKRAAVARELYACSWPAKFEEAAEHDRQLEGVKRQIKALEAEMQSHGMSLSESGSQTGAAVQWEQDHHSEKSGTSGFGRTFFSDSVPGDGRTIRSFCSGASTGSNDEDDRGSKDGAGTVYTIGSLYSQAHAEGGGEDAGKSPCRPAHFNILLFLELTLRGVGRQHVGTHLRHGVSRRKGEPGRR